MIAVNQLVLVGTAKTEVEEKKYQSKPGSYGSFYLEIERPGTNGEKQDVFEVLIFGEQAIQKAKTEVAKDAIVAVTGRVTSSIYQKQNNTRGISYGISAYSVTSYHVGPQEQPNDGVDLVITEDDLPF